MPRKSHCALCSNPVDPAFKPFCSRGCRDRDLLSWFGEAYRTPGRPTDEEADSPPSSGNDD
ncbi:MAG TPA: DNA gyrase inhibitor YacG [Sphingobium sp.]